MRRKAAALGFLALLASGGSACRSPTTASTDLNGTWDLAYSTISSRSCGPPSPAGHSAGCGGGGRLTLAHVGETITGSLPLVGYCQSCRSVADAFGFSVQPVTGHFRDGRLELRVFLTCQVTAAVGPGEVTEVSGSATCVFDGEQTRGTWRMSRAP